MNTLTTMSLIAMLLLQEPDGVGGLPNTIAQQAAKERNAAGERAYAWVVLNQCAPIDVSRIASIFGAAAKLQKSEDLPEDSLGARLRYCEWTMASSSPRPWLLRMRISPRGSGQHPRAFSFGASWRWTRIALFNKFSSVECFRVQPTVVQRKGATAKRVQADVKPLPKSSSEPTETKSTYCSTIAMGGYAYEVSTHGSGLHDFEDAERLEQLLVLAKVINLDHPK